MFHTTMNDSQAEVITQQWIKCRNLELSRNVESNQVKHDYMGITKIFSSIFTEHI